MKRKKPVVISVILEAETLDSEVLLDSVDKSVDVSSGTACNPRY